MEMGILSRFPKFLRISSGHLLEYINQTVCVSAFIVPLRAKKKKNTATIEQFPVTNV